jgi:hypothetical protein
MATITYMSFLMHGTGSGTLTWADLCPIKDYPDFMNSVNAIDITDLQQNMHTYIMGLKDSGGGDMPFTCNYDKTQYTAIKALEGTEQNLAIWFGGTEASDGTVTPTGSDGKWSFKGFISVGIVGKGVDEAREMQIHVTPTTVMAFE